MPSSTRTRAVTALTALSSTTHSYSGASVSQITGNLYKMAPSDPLPLLPQAYALVAETKLFLYGPEHEMVKEYAVLLSREMRGGEFVEL